jgi:hypothetical protein
MFKCLSKPKLVDVKYFLQRLSDRLGWMGMGSLFGCHSPHQSNSPTFGQTLPPGSAVGGFRRQTELMVYVCR